MAARVAQREVRAHLGVARLVVAVERDVIRPISAHEHVPPPDGARASGAGLDERETVALREEALAGAAAVHRPARAFDIRLVALAIGLWPANALRRDGARRAARRQRRRRRRVRELWVTRTQPRVVGAHGIARAHDVAAGAIGADAFAVADAVAIPVAATSAMRADRRVTGIWPHGKTAGARDARCSRSNPHGGGRRDGLQPRLVAGAARHGAFLSARGALVG